MSVRTCGQTPALIAAFLAATLFPAMAPAAPPVALKPAEAAEMFRRVCVDTAPDFAGARAAMAAEGMEKAVAHGFLTHPLRALKARVTTSPEGHAVCEMVFQLDGTALALDKEGVKLRLAPGLRGRIVEDDAPGEDGMTRLQLTMK